MFTVKRIDTGEYLTTQSAFGSMYWSADIDDSAQFKRKSTADNRARTFNSEDNWVATVACRVVEITLSEVIR